MKGKKKMIMGVALALGIVSIALFATPIQAYVNGLSNGDLLQTQNHDRMRLKENCECDGDMLQTRNYFRERLRTQNCDCNCTSSSGQNRYQYRNQNREMTNLTP